jgi:hypothetical protein
MTAAFFPISFLKLILDHINHHFSLYQLTIIFNILHHYFILVYFINIIHLFEIINIYLINNTLFDHDC